MARLIPRIDPASIANSGERVIATELVRQLPDSCLVYHSYPWLRFARSDYSQKEFLQPGETDFIVLDPAHGLLVLEVKGAMEYVPSTHEFYRLRDRGGRDQIQNPFDRAARNLYALRDMILAHEELRGRKTLPFTYGYAVAFPHCVYSGPLPPDAEPGIVFGANHLTDLGDRVRAALAAWSRAAHPRPIDSNLRDAIQESLSPIFKLTPVLWKSLEEQEEKLRRLTSAQEMVLRALVNQPRAAIEGVAGSGKTILALGQAQRFARQGKRTLFLCYNRPLAEWLDQQLPAKLRAAITIETFHGLCSAFCKLARIPFNGSVGDDDFWSYTAPDLLEKACQALGREHKFEAVVVDEGQDFRDLWWLALEKVQRTVDAAFPFYVFYDPKQNIYISHPTLPSNLASFVLPTNCRNTRLIARLCGEIIHESIDVHEEAPDGIAPKIIMAVSDADVVKRTRDQVHDWCLRERGGLVWNKVAVLTPTDAGKEWPTSFGNIPLTDNFDHWRAGNGVLLSTCRRFKGLEADALILAGIPKPDTKKYFSNADYYVAASRAKHVLTVIATESF